MNHAAGLTAACAVAFVFAFGAPRITGGVPAIISPVAIR